MGRITLHGAPTATTSDGMSLCDNAAGTYDSIIAYGDAGKNCHSGAKPAVAAYVYRRVVLILLLAQNRQNGMTCSGDYNTRTYHCMTAYINMRVVNER